MVRLIVGILLLCLNSAAYAEKSIRLYHDADWSNHIESAESIWRGVQTALSEIDHTVQGYRLELVQKNHSGNVRRSFANYQDFLEDESALLVFSGIHSPPLIKNRNFINESQALTLVPWAAGGPITRSETGENWIFRLSVDDTKAGEVLINHAINVVECKAPHLLLEDTPWGDSNLVNMKRALEKTAVAAAGVTRFNWHLKGHTARSKLVNIAHTGADCVVMVSNAIEGAELVNAMLDLEPAQVMPIVSHWGITAGNFHELVDAEQRAKLDLTYIQTCFSFIGGVLNDKAESVYRTAKSLYPDQIQTARDIRSPVGFIHAYDLTQVLIAALSQITLSDDMVANRKKLHTALEDMQRPVQGLVKNYVKPFEKYTPERPDAHEALDIADHCMAFYGQNDEVVVINDR
ncbi:MAG: ABC transporter substrate-binding protein [Pseudomonadota bacterium]